MVWWRQSRWQQGWLPHQVEAIGIYLFPIHQLIFGKMLRSIVEVVEKSARSFHEPA
jgi:hypothetical protein